MWLIILVIILICGMVECCLMRKSFGSLPRGERLERIKQSPNYSDGKFQNLEPTLQLTQDKPMVYMFLKMLFGKKLDNAKPKEALLSAKTDLKNIDRSENVFVWFGHSSCFIQIDGKRFLIDPVFYAASPLSSMNKPFKGAGIYTADDMPDIDYLLISHDHWDHLEYKTVMTLKDKPTKIITGLGVGEHFEYWGFEPSRIIELDWNDSIEIDVNFKVYCLPARHFSGRGLLRNPSLWAAFLIQSPSKNIFISGDGGYGSHFADIARRFPNIDFAILENGQYSDNWKYIHTQPDLLPEIVKVLNPKRFVTVHNSKFSLSDRHRWYEPLDRISEVSERNYLPLITPMIGEKVELDNAGQTFQKWWKNN
ncbi:MAG: MBL fold metallo-hydrolase [Prevotellaceae bacterium]|nr:MBL fold metallo-hydrolase [Prevotellaceae bacterium]